MCIGNVDAPNTKSLDRRLERRTKYREAVESTSRQLESKSDVAAAAETDTTTTSRARLARPDFTALLTTQSSSSSGESTSEASMDNCSSSQSSYNTMSVINLAKAADRYDVSDTTTAALASAAYLDAGMISENNTILVVDRSKIRIARRALRSASVESLHSETLHAFFFDGRKDM